MVERRQCYYFDLDLQWQTLYGEHTTLDIDSNETNDREIGLSALRGKCYNCGEKGHRRKNCPSKQNGGVDNNKKKFQGELLQL